MLLYSILMFAVFLLLTVLSVMIYRGRTNLIHSYHQERVKDKAGYGRAFGKALFVFALAPFISGMVGLFADPSASSTVFLAVFALMVGVIVGFYCLWTVQKKYNRGLF